MSIEPLAVIQWLFLLETLGMRRREFLCQTSAMAASATLCQNLAMSARAFEGGLLPPTVSHHGARAKQLVFVFLTGGFSHVDTFDPKPKLKEDHGKVVSAESLRESAKEPLLGSPFRFDRYGESGMEISELF